MIKIWRGGRPSGGARELARAVGGRVNRRRNSRLRARAGDLLVNWGTSTLPPGDASPHIRILNHPECVEVAANKLAFYQACEGKEWCPSFTEDMGIALGWARSGVKVMARTMLRASQGRGVHLYLGRPNEVLIRAPLYVEYVPKKWEYRIHVFNGEILDVQMKRKRQEVPNEDVNYQVRNHGNGWVFCRNEIVDPPAAALDAAKEAVRACSLSFGAVDLGVRERDGRVTVYEVNTAPGLEGTTLDRYAQAIREAERGYL